MSLEEETVAEETVRKLGHVVIDLMQASARLYSAIIEKNPRAKGLFKKVKKLAEEISEICEELP